MTDLSPSMPLGLGYSPGNLDLASQLAEIERQRQLMSGLLTSSIVVPDTQFTPGGAGVGGVAIRHGPGEIIARALTSGMASNDLDQLATQQQGLAQQQAAKAGAAMSALGASTGAQPGTPTVITEEAGPPDPVTGQPSVSVRQGTAPAMDPSLFWPAYAKAQYAGVDPGMLKFAADQFYANRILAANPQTAGYVPGMAGGGQPVVTPGDVNHGASVAVPTTASMLMSGAAPPSGGGSMPPSVASAMPFLLAGPAIPALGKAGEAMIDYGKPADYRPGSLVKQADGTYLGVPNDKGIQNVYDATGAVVGTRVAPGYSQAAAAQAGAVAGATEAGKGAANMTMIDVGGGAKRPAVPVYDENNNLVSYRLLPTTPAGGAAPSPHTGAPPPAGTPPSAAAADAAGQPVRITVPASGQPQVPGAPLGSAGPGDGTSDTKHYFGTIPPRPAAAISIGSTQTTEQAATSAAQGKTYADQQADIDTHALGAAQTIARGNELKAFAGMFEPGASSELRMEGAKWLQNIPGVTVSPDFVNDVAGGSLPAMQSMGKLVVGNAFEAMRQMLGPGQRIGQQEVMLNAQNQPNMLLTRPAINAMVDLQNGLGRWRLAMQEAKQDWMTPTSDNPNPSYAGFETWWNKTNPPEKYIPSEQALRKAFGLGSTGTQPSGAQSAGASAAPAQAGPMRARNPTTGETMSLVNGKWVSDQNAAQTVTPPLGM